MSEHLLHVYADKHEFREIAGIVGDHLDADKPFHYGVSRPGLEALIDALNETKVDYDYYRDLPEGEVHELLDQFDADFVLSWLENRVKS